MRTSLTTIDSRRILAPLLVLILAALCLWLLIRLLLAAGTQLSASTGTDLSTSAAPSVSMLAPRESLARWHLFGSASRSIDARSPANAPETTLDLRLVGVLAEADPRAGIAMISAADGEERAYRVEAELPGGARLREVHRDHVVLSHGGRDELLQLPRQGEDAAPGSSAALPTAGPAATRTSSPISPVAVAGMETVDWSSVQRQMQIDPAELARQVRILPVLEGGTMIGVRLSGGANTPLLAQLGLRPDDVVTSVNGFSVLDTGRANQVIAEMSTADRATVTIRRDGREETLTVSLR